MSIPRHIQRRRARRYFRDAVIAGLLALFCLGVVALAGADGPRFDPGFMTGHLPAGARSVRAHQDFLRAVPRSPHQAWAENSGKEIAFANKTNALI